MQAFGRAPELQAAKIQEVAARSAVLGKVVEKMLTKDPRRRISSAELANELQPGRGGREKTFSDPLLESLSDVSLHEIKAVHKLRGELDGDDVDLSEIPNHIGGGVALLRVVRSPQFRLSNTFGRCWRHGQNSAATRSTRRSWKSDSR